MKIAFVRRNWSATGGAENYLLRIARTLKEKGHECVLLCESWSVKNDSHQSNPFADIITFQVGGWRPLKPLNFAKQVNAWTSSHPTVKVFSMERGTNADVYRAGDGVHAVWLEHRARFSKKPFLAHLSNFVNLKHWVLCHLEKETFRPAITQTIIANSEMVKAEILDRFAFPQERIIVIPNGVNYEFFSSGDRKRGREALGVAEKDFVVLLVGAGKERKGHRFAQEAVTLANQKQLHGTAKLLIIDHPPSCSMPDAYAAADIFLLPTLYDPFANVTLEAMAAGLPVITTLQNGGQQVIQTESNGLLAETPAHTEQISEWIIRLYQENEFRSSISQKGKQTVSSHAQNANAEAFLKLLE